MGRFFSVFRRYEKKLRLHNLFIATDRLQPSRLCNRRRRRL